MAEPFLKWVGGKRQLVNELLLHVELPVRGTYYEPFVGGGALFFTVQGMHGLLSLKARLNDANPHLINVYTQVRDNVEVVLKSLAGWDKVCEQLGLADAYKHCRDDFNGLTRAEMLPHYQAARFIAMNAWGFNGLCRYNKKGGFNVPCGKFSKTPVLMNKAPNLRAASVALRGVSIGSEDYHKAVFSKAKRNDIVYFDPPYIPASSTADFTSYTAGGFTLNNQIELRDLAVVLKEKGVNVILSNSDTPKVRELYDTGDFDLHPVQARRAVNCSAEKRGAVGELIIVGRK